MSVYLLILLVTNLFELAVARSVNVRGFSDSVPDVFFKEKLAYRPLDPMIVGEEVAPLYKEKIRARSVSKSRIRETL